MSEQVRRYADNAALRRTLYQIRLVGRTKEGGKGDRVRTSPP